MDPSYNRPITPTGPPRAKESEDEQTRFRATEPTTRLQADHQEKAMTITQSSKDVVQRAITALNERNRETVAELHTEDAVLSDLDEEFHGVEAVIEHEWARYDAFPDMEYTIEEILADGDSVAARWLVTGTHEGEFEGIPPTGASVEFPVSGLFRVADGTITEIRLLYDALGMLQQLGVVEAPTT